MMQSVGEVMAIGRTFPESLQKALRSLETGRSGSTAIRPKREYDAHRRRGARAHGRGRHARAAVPARGGAAARRVASSASHEATGIDPWFLDQIAAIIDERGTARGRSACRAWTRRDVAAGQAARLLRRAARATCGASTRPTCAPRGSRPASRSTFKTVDTCAAEFAARRRTTTATYEDEDEVRTADPAAGGDPRLAVPIASAKGSSSTTAACTRRSRCATPASRP